MKKVKMSRDEQYLVGKGFSEDSLERVVSRTVSRAFKAAGEVSKARKALNELASTMKNIGAIRDGIESKDKLWLSDFTNKLYELIGDIDSLTYRM